MWDLRLKDGRRIRDVHSSGSRTRSCFKALQSSKKIGAGLGIVIFRNNIPQNVIPTKLAADH